VKTPDRNAATDLKRMVKDVLFGPLVPQAAWEWLHQLALRGMNIGGGSNVTESGELWVIEKVADHLRRLASPVVFDIGANVGSYCALLLEHLPGPVDLHCFEPSVAAYRELQHRLGARAGVHLHRLGLSDASGEAFLHGTPDNTAMSSMYARDLPHLGLKLDSRESIELATIDGICGQFRIEHVGFMKLDCEGHELKVMQGGRSLFERGAVDLVQFEFGGCNLDSRTYLKDFFEFLTPRFRIHRVLRRGLAPVDRYRETGEIFTTTNFLAVRTGVAFG
jgi:FkbM family methyltransferase